MSVLRPTLNEELSSPESKISLNREMFGRIAREYDFMTKALSFNQDAAWKQRLIEGLPELESPVCVDLACGTGDFAFLIAKRYPKGTVTGIDLTPEMVELAQQRKGESYPNATFEVGNMGDLSAIAADSVDLVTGGYALRNAPDLEQALGEIARILRPGGYAAFLDFSRSPNAIASAWNVLMLKIWGGMWGLFRHGKPWVYGYIADSLAKFPDRERLSQLLDTTGFAIQKRRLEMGGMMEILFLQRKAESV